MPIIGIPKETGIVNGSPRTASQGVDWHRTYTRFWLIETSGKEVGAVEVLKAVPVAIGQSYVTATEFDAGAFVNEISVSEVGEDGCSWLATVQYGPYNAIETQPQVPTDAQPEMNWSWAQFRKVVKRDKDDKPVLNTAFDPFDPPLEIDDPRPILQIVRNEATFNPDLVYAYRNAINDAPWFGGDPLCWKVTSIIPQRLFNADIGYYYRMTYEWQFDPDTWVFKVPNVGMRALNLSLTKQSKMLDSDGHPIDEPRPLKPDGTPKGIGQAADNLEFHIYPELSFDVFNFDAFYLFLIGG
jgi:hypothetical protein